MGTMRGGAKHLHDIFWQANITMLGTQCLNRELNMPCPLLEQERRGSVRVDGGPPQPAQRALPVRPTND
eukprot:3908982-Pyramimonas_sp.AAC.2